MFISFFPWDDIISKLPQLLNDGTLREETLALPLLSTDRIHSEAEWRRAYSMLAFLAHGYIWGGKQAAEILPIVISKPFTEVAQRLDLPPVLSYAACNLWNFTSDGGDFTDLENLQPLHSFTGTVDEAWFLVVSVAMEAQTASIIPVMKHALDAVRTREYDVISGALEKLIICISKVGALLERMYEKCNEDVFYHQIRPYLAGSKNMEAAGLPRGVFYTTGDDGEGNWMQLRGGSNGQSSIIQFFDIVLGIQHKHEGPSNPLSSEACATRTFHEEVRDYMPAGHRRFLLDVSRMGSIRQLANLPASTAEQQRLCATYIRATETLGVFRSKHITLVTRYIVLPSRRAATAQSGKQNLASASAEVQAIGGRGGPEADAELKGTGGTTLIPFLKQVRDETVEAGLLKA
ncbi:putative indoleamine 2,3-dioxygenase [Seiridium cardinale]